MKQKRFLSMFALLLMAATGAWADDTYTVQFKANGNTKTVENVVLPHQFRCDFSSENGELDQIIKELYGLSGGYCNGDLHSSGNENVTCGSSDMDDYITISAPFEGTATVTGWYYSSTLIQYSLEISIPSYVAPTVNVTGVSLSETTASMTVGGDALTLTATVAPDDATDKTVTWTTSDAAVATVADGVVTAVAAGTATITATATNGTADTSDDKTATCTVTVAEPTYTVTVKEGTEDAANWSVSPTEAAEGATVTASYSGEKKVKSVKAVKKALDPAKAYLTWDADQKQLVATEIPTTAIKVENAENVSWAGTYVVEDDVTISGTIGLSGEVDLIIKDGATLTAKQIGGNGNNLRIYGQANQSGQLVVNRTNGDAIMNIKTLEVHSAQLTATSSTNSCGGIYGTTTFNVYGGLVDAKCTGAGYGISLNSGGSINIHGGEVKAEGKGTNNYGYGIRCANTATVTVNGGKLWAENADKKALNNINIQKGTGFTGKIEYSSDKSTWSETVDANAKYVRAGY